MKVSVIVPVYNVEKYLHQCVDSVLGQTYRDLEVILVDDGSTDGCPGICDDYARMDSRVRVIHQENGGLSAARNAGIAHITGEYVLFLDSDDFWDNPDGVGILVQRIGVTNVDVLNFSFKKYNEKSGTKKRYISRSVTMPINCVTKKDQLRFISKSKGYISSACTKMIRREILSEELNFERDVFSEDIVWSAHLLCVAESMDFLDTDFYCYRQRSGSISHSITDKKCRDVSRHIVECVRICEQAGEAEVAALLHYAAFQFCTFFVVQAQAGRWQEECIAELKRNSWILKYHYNGYYYDWNDSGTCDHGCGGVQCRWNF